METCPLLLQALSAVTDSQFLGATSVVIVTQDCQLLSTSSNKAPTVAIFSVRKDARDVKKPWSPRKKFHNSSLKNINPQQRSSQSHREPILQVQFSVPWRFCKTARECELEGLGISVKHTTGTWTTCSRPGPGILVQDL